MSSSQRGVTDDTDTFESDQLVVDRSKLDAAKKQSPVKLKSEDFDHRYMKSHRILKTLCLLSFLVVCLLAIIIVVTVNFNEVRNVKRDLNELKQQFDFLKNQLRNEKTTAGVDVPAESARNRRHIIDDKLLLSDVGDSQKCGCQGPQGLKGEPGRSYFIQQSRTKRNYSNKRGVPRRRSRRRSGSPQTFFNGQFKYTEIIALKGEPGIVGMPGRPGKDGPMGQPGPKGESSEASLSCETCRSEWAGISGPPGPPGPKGDMGPISVFRSDINMKIVQGPKGSKGEVGAQGKRGRRGQAVSSSSSLLGNGGAIYGSSGARGMKGEKGDSGSTARCEIECLRSTQHQQNSPQRLFRGVSSSLVDPNDVAGSEQQQSKCEKGQSGDLGPPGLMGAPGLPGPPGYPGPKGEKGECDIFHHGGESSHLTDSTKHFGSQSFDDGIIAPPRAMMMIQNHGNKKNPSPTSFLFKSKLAMAETTGPSGLHGIKGESGVMGLPGPPGPPGKDGTCSPVTRCKKKKWRRRKKHSSDD